MHNLDINIDIKATKQYREINSYQCDCSYCRNYYISFKDKYPKTAEFIEEFGLDINFPLEAMPLPYNSKDKTMGYTVYYPVKGEVLNEGLELKLEGLYIRILKGSDSKNLCPKPEMEESYLLIEINDIRLPWVLDEDIELFP